MTASSEVAVRCFFLLSDVLFGGGRPLLFSELLRLAQTRSPLTNAHFPSQLSHQFPFTDCAFAAIDLGAFAAPRCSIDRNSCWRLIAGVWQKTTHVRT